LLKQNKIPSYSLKLWSGH